MGQEAKEETADQFFAAWRYYCNDQQACFLVIWLRKESSIAAPRLLARRKLSCLFCYGKGRCFVPILRRPETIPGLQLQIKHTAVVKLADQRGFPVAVGDILPQIEISLSLCVAIHTFPGNLCCSFVYLNRGAVTICTAQALRHSKVMVLPGRAQLELRQRGLMKLGLCCCELLFVKSLSLSLSL